MALGDPGHTVDTWRSLARYDDLVVTEVDGEVIVYDTQTQTMHYLDSMSHTIWSLCDGTKAVDAIRQAAAAQSGMELSSDAVLLALRQLADARLLVEPMPAFLTNDRSSRRRLVRKLGAMAVLPVITSISAPTAAQATSGVCLRFKDDCNPAIPCCEGLACYEPYGRCLRADCRPPEAFCLRDEDCCSESCISICL